MVSNKLARAAPNKRDVLAGFIDFGKDQFGGLWRGAGGREREYLSLMDANPRQQLYKILIN